MAMPAVAAPDADFRPRRAVPAADRLPRRILMTTDTVGGVWTYSLELAAGLAAHEVEVVLVVHGPAPDAAQRAKVAALPNAVLVTSGIELEWRDGRGIPDRASADRLHDLERRHAPDLVHLNGFRDAVLDWPVPVIVVAHSCVHSWWRACRGEPAPTSWGAYGRAVAAGLARATAVVAPTAAFLAEMEAIYGRLPTARAIHNGTTPRQTFPTSEREPVILTVGRSWDEAKNIRLLEQVAPSLAWPVRVIGEPPAQRSPHLDWQGRLPPRQVHAAMATAGIYCSPALYEPFGLAILEAAAHGVPLVLGCIPSLVELWDEAALFVDPHDAATLTAALDALIADPALRHELGRAARHRAAHFTSGRMMAAYRALYAELLAADRPLELPRS